MIKRAAVQLLKGENNFDSSYEHNKKILGDSMPSKPIRNRIAGYIARLKRMESAEKAKASV